MAARSQDLGSADDRFGREAGSQPAPESAHAANFSSVLRCSGTVWPIVATSVLSRCTVLSGDRSGSDRQSELALLRVPDARRFQARYALLQGGHPGAFRPPAPPEPRQGWHPAERSAFVPIHTLGYDQLAEWPGSVPELRRNRSRLLIGQNRAGAEHASFNIGRRRHRHLHRLPSRVEGRQCHRHRAQRNRVCRVREVGRVPGEGLVRRDPSYAPRPPQLRTSR